MIQDVDLSVEALLKLELGNPLPFDLSFAIPDDTFAPVSNMRPTLNCYLYDIRENRDLRSLEVRMHRTGTGTIYAEPAPVKVQVSYCITAWSPAQAGGGVTPVSDEHRLLGQVTQALLRHPELPDGALVGSLAGQEPLPSTNVIIADPLRRVGEFWSAVQGKLRPSLDYAVTFGMPTVDPFDGPMVTGITSLVRIGAAPGDQLQIASGVVQTDDAVPVPIADAWIRVVETRRTYTSDASGEFVIDRIAPGLYTLIARAVGYQEGSAQLRVPTTTGPVLISLTLL
jgi:hypothetical protein